MWMWTNGIEPAYAVMASAIRAPDWVYVPVRVPAGVNRITVSYSYDKPAPPPGYDGSALDIGVFDEGGVADLASARVRRRKILNGLISEYSQAA